MLQGVRFYGRHFRGVAMADLAPPSHLMQFRQCAALFKGTQPKMGTKERRNRGAEVLCKHGPRIRRSCRVRVSRRRRRQQRGEMQLKRSSASSNLSKIYLQSFRMHWQTATTIRRKSTTKKKKESFLHGKNIE